MIGNFLAKNRLTLLAAGVLMICAVAVNTRPASAAVSGALSAQSPAYYASGTGDPADFNMTRHMMIISDHGVVSTITTGLYWNSPGARSVTVLDANQGNGGLCQIYDAKKEAVKANKPDKHAISDIYLRITFTAPGASKTYVIRGDRICGGNGNNTATSTSVTNRFFGNYAIPANVASVFDANSGRYKVTMTIKFDDDYASYFAAGGGDQKFTFRVQNPGGYAATLDTTSSTNSSVVGKFAGGFSLIRQLLPFGRSCRSASPAAPQEVTVYDADNTDTLGNPLKFYIAQISEVGGNTSIRPLGKDEYATQLGNGVGSDANGVASVVDGIVVYRSLANYQNGLEITYPWSGSNSDAPLIRPGNYSGSGGRGGYTRVWIKNMKSLKDDPTAHYALVVQNLHSNGDRQKNNNFIGYGLPGDGVFGFSNFNCPAAADIDTEIHFDPATDVSPGDPLMAQASITSSGGATTVSSANVKIWYTNTRDDDTYGAGDLAVPGSFLFPTAAGPYSNGTTKTSPAYNNLPVRADYKYICASIDVAGTFGTTRNSDCVTVVLRPYLKIYGGDAAAGTSPKDGDATCSTANNDAGFLGWNDASAGWGGAGAQFAVQALGIIDGFASASGTVGGEVPPSGLAFANTVAGIGGQFGSVDGINCDYTSDLTLEPNPGTLAGRTVAQGTDETHYYNGDVYISGNIVYSAAGRTDISKIPSFRLVVVGGDITIDKSVDTLDGTYVAEPDASGNGGTIYTCGDPSTRQPIAQNDPTYFDDCYTPLTINGSFVAKKVQFLRTPGDYKSASVAESFRYSPELWLGNVSADIGGKDASITSLPPVL